MKVKKLLGFIVTSIIFICILASTKTYAAESSYQLGITNLREKHGNQGQAAYEVHSSDASSGQAQAVNRKIWKIVSYKGNQINYDNAFYCLRAEHGFVLNGSNQDVTTVRKTYDVALDMKTQKDQVLQKLKDVNAFNNSSDASTTYNKIMWILDNMYLPKQSDESVKEQLFEAAEITGEDDSYYPEYTSRLTDDDIEVIQQMALWYYTNPDSNVYHTSVSSSTHRYTLPTLFFNNCCGKDECTKSLADWFPDNDDGRWRQVEAEMLYDYFIRTAETQGNYTSKDATTPIALDKSRVTVVNKNGKYIIGPIKFERKSDLAYSGEEVTLVNEKGGTFTYTLQDTPEGSSSGDLKSKLTSNRDFYIAIDENTAESIERIKLNFKIKYSKTTTTYYTTSNSTYKQEQPVVLVEKQNPEYSETLEVKIPKVQEFDLALRKFVSKVGSTTHAERTPVPNISSLRAGTATTATYTHPKTPVPVKTGDIVTYTIRVYNEGQKAGYASKIVDHLPAGLELVDSSQSSINRTYGWSKVSGTNDIQTTYLATHLIDAFDGSNLKFQDIQVECKVVATATDQNQTLKNVAEIADDKDNSNQNVDDRDSQPSDKTQIQGYTGSIQDDDDFEDLLLQAEYFDLALQKFITKVGNTTITNRTPVPDVTALAAGTATTATYNRETREPILVKKGDIVVYTIRVYNEGKIAGYATKITDHLPAGLELVNPNQSKINADNGWTKVVGTNDIQTTALADDLIPAFDGKDLKYVDLQVQCEVIVDTTDVDQTLRNVAEITEDKNEFNRPGNDRDSTPGNANQQHEDDDDYENLKIEGKEFDLALRKFITKVDGKPLSIDREPTADKIDKTPLTDPEYQGEKTAKYTHPKTPVSVEIGSVVTYTIRVFNEGERDGYAQEITDHLPEGLEFLPQDEENINNGWILDDSDSTLKTVKTKHLSKESELEAGENLIPAFDGKTLSYKEVQIKCKVQDRGVLQVGGKLTNIAEITDFANEEGKNVLTATSSDGTTKEQVPLKDRDSQKAYPELSVYGDLPTYKDPEIERGDVYIPGQQDDDDFEKVEVHVFDLALQKFITKINNKDITTREPKPVLTNGKITYQGPEDPVEVSNGDTVIYTIRVYNEGDIAGYAKEIRDDLPEGLEFLPDHEINEKWKMIDKDGKETDNVEDAVEIRTDVIANELLKAFDRSAGIVDTDQLKNPDYRDIQVAFKVVEPATSGRILINTAEITKDADEEGNPGKDIDSTPDNNKPEEDDQDDEKVKLTYFDLALQKFLVKDGETDINNRAPKVLLSEDGKITYQGPEDPVEVTPSDIVIYTIRIYNEGTKAGYATEITDDLPSGLEFLPEHEINEKWKMIDKDGKETDNVKDAVKITTDALADELLKPFDKDSEIADTDQARNPDYRDVQVAFKVVEPATSDRIVINTAQISEDADQNGDPVEDIDSTPGNNEPEEDDQDDEKIKVKYFDLSLKKWVTQAIVIKDGKQTVTNTGHTGDENPEPTVKVDLKSSEVNKVVVKFVYSIRVTNEGQIAGYAKEVKDYIPQNLRFDEKDNPQWKKVNDKEVVTEQLADKLLKPGESATVSITLTWINGANNMGISINTAEISKDYNESNTPDKDSTPNNKKPGEDDIDDAPVILTPRTGQTKLYIGLTTIILVIFAGGVYAIKKYVLR